MQFLRVQLFFPSPSLFLVFEGAEAYLRVYKTCGLSFIDRQLIGLEDEMTSHCISSIPELFDGNPPYVGRGAVSFAMNVAEILRVLKLKSKYNY